MKNSLDLIYLRQKRIMKKIRNKTFSFNLKTLSIFLDLGDRVKLDSP